MLPESYSLSVKEDHVVLGLREGGFTREQLGAPVPPAPYSVVCRLGDAHLLECVVWRREEGHGGVFILKNPAILFAAYADNELVYALALAYFGKLVAEAKYGADIFEALEEEND